MTIQQKPILHGRDHCPGGPDPIPCLMTGSGTFTGAVTRISDLLAYWRLGESSGNWLDTSGVGTADPLIPQGSGAALSRNVTGALSGDDDGAVEFNYDGSSDGGGRWMDTAGSNKDFNRSGATDHDITVCAWAKTKSSALTRNGLIAGTSQWSIPGGYQIGYGLKITYPNRKVRFTYGQPSGGAEAYAESAAGLVVGDWTFLVGTYDGTTHRLYINGDLEDETTGGFEPNADDIFRVGHTYDNIALNPSFFYGTVDEVAVWTRALTQAEIDLLYLAGVGGQFDSGSRVLVSDGHGGFTWGQANGEAIEPRAIENRHVSDSANIDVLKLEHPGGTTSFLRADGTWATPPGTVSADTLWDAKGDLAAGTGADAAARLPVGTNGQILSADSSQSTGLKWVPDAGGDPSADTSVWMPLFDADGALILDGDGGLIPTLIPI